MYNVGRKKQRQCHNVAHLSILEMILCKCKSETVHVLDFSRSDEPSLPCWGWCQQACRWQLWVFTQTIFVQHIVNNKMLIMCNPSVCRFLNVLEWSHSPQQC